MLGRERARYLFLLITKTRGEKGVGVGGHAGNCAIAVGFKGATRVSWSVINAVVESLLEKCIVAPLSPRSGGTSISTSPPAAVVAAAGGGKKKRSIMSSRCGTYFCDPFKFPDLLISIFLTRGSFVCLCVFTSVVGIRKSVNSFPHEIEVAFISKTGMKTVVVV